VCVSCTQSVGKAFAELKFGILLGWPSGDDAHTWRELKLAHFRALSTRATESPFFHSSQ